MFGSRVYKVRVSTRRFDEGDCECYLGQNDELCKHMVAVAIYAILGGRPLLEEEKQQKNDISLTWFIYQNSLSEDCSRLAATVSELPVSLQTAELLVDLLLRMDKKLCTGGVDDSDGVVGGCMEEIVGVT